MFRDDVQVALNDVLLQAEHTARHYRDSASLCRSDDAALAGRLNRLGAEREAQVEQLRYQLRALQDLPDAADTEWDTLQAVGERLAARLPGGGPGAVLRERIQDEERLASLATAALDQPVPGAARQLLEHVRRSARAAVESLGDAQRALG